MRRSLPKYKCSAKACRAHVLPHHLHPIFEKGRTDKRQPLQVQAAALLLLLVRASTPQCRALLGLNRKMVEGMRALGETPAGLCQAGGKEHNLW